MVVKANGYDYVAEGEIILVKPRTSFQQDELETKVYRLKYLDANNLNAVDNDDGSNWCAATAAYNGADLGTPGAANPTCSP